MGKSNVSIVTIAGKPVAASVTLTVSPTSGNTLANFGFSGTALDASGNPVSGQPIVGYFQGQPYTDVAFTTTTDSHGNFSTLVGNWSPGTYDVYAAAVNGYGAGGASSPEISATSPTVTFTVSANKLTCASTGYYSVLTEPDGSHYVNAVVPSVTGGELPYDYVYHWSDGVVEDKGTAASDVRYFAPGVPPALPSYVTVTSTDGQTCTVPAFQSY